MARKTRNTTETNPKAAVPVLLISFIFCLVVDNGFKFMSQPIAADLNLSVPTVSLQATLAGIVIGIGAVVYAALADAISIKKLMMVGIAFIVVGSLMGFFFHTSWPMVLAGRIIQTCGLAAAETLYVIYVTKYLPLKDRKTYLGFSTACFQSALLIGVLTSGAVATYISWTMMFIIPLAMVFTLPFIMTKIPETRSTTSNLDVFGLFLIALVATCVIMFTQAWNWWWIIPAAAGIAVFVWHILSHAKALVRPEFFTNGRYVWALALVLIVYSVQLAYIFLFPYAVNALHGFDLAEASWLIAPGYAVAAIVGALSGVVGRFLTSRQTIMAAICLIVGALALGAIFVESSQFMLVISIGLFATAFALLYAPLVATAISTIPAEKSGIAIGFYNLTINIAIPVGIAYVAKLVASHIEFFGFLSLTHSVQGAHYATILWILAIIAGVGGVMYMVADGVMTGSEKRAARSRR